MISLVPVDNDPFELATNRNIGLVPVEHNPFEKKENFLEKVSETAVGRAVGGGIDKIGKAGADVLTGKTNPLYAALGIGAGGIQTATGLATGAIGSAFQQLPDLGVTKSIGDTGRALRGEVSGFLQDTNVGRNIGDYLMNNPKAADFMNRTGQAAKDAAIVTAFNPSLFIKGGDLATKATGKAIEAGKRFEQASLKAPSILGDTAGARFKPTSITDQMAKAAVDNAYADVRSLGGQFSTKLADDAHSFIQKAKVRPFADDILTKEDKLINDALSDYDTLAGKSLTLDDYRRLDSSLGDKAAAAYVSGRVNEGRIISNVQDKIRGMITQGEKSNAYFAGSKEGVDVLTKDAIPLAAAEFKLRDLQKIAERASVMDNPTTAIRTGYRNLMMSNKFKTYPKDVQKLIVKAADTGAVDDLLGIVGNRLNFIAGMAGGNLGQAAVSGASSFVSRGIRDRIRQAKAGKVISAVMEPLRPNIEKYSNPVIRPPTPPEPPFVPYGLLPAPTYQVSPAGVAATAAQREAIGRGYSAPNPTIQELMAMPPAQAQGILQQMIRARSKFDYRGNPLQVNITKNPKNN